MLDENRSGEKTREGRLFVLAGPSGVGKGTLRTKALSGLENLIYSISCTTRQPREGERDGVEYHFVTARDFEEMIAGGLFLEHAVVHGNRYGTLLKDVELETGAGRDVLLEIDVQGARQVKAILPESVLIFIAPPSLDVLEKRLRQRKTESEDKISLRLENAKKEIALSSEYDHIIVNDDLEKACTELRGLILSYKRH
jgi:guanylate kinase